MAMLSGQYFNNDDKLAEILTKIFANTSIPKEYLFLTTTTGVQLVADKDLSEQLKVDGKVPEGEIFINVIIKGAIRVNLANSDTQWLSSPDLKTVADLKQEFIKQKIPIESIILTWKKKLLKDTDKI